MPTPPKKKESKNKFMSRCMMTFKAERVPHQQAVARCLNAWKNKGKSKKSV